jgi:tetratricopeptide (TPR) repeat protein
MSLLIKALQKAEETKGAAVDVAGQDADKRREMELELASDLAAATRFNLELQGGFDELLSSNTKAANPTKQQQTASTVFAAKHDSGAESVDSSRALWIGMSGLVFLLLAGGGFYYYLDNLQQPQPLIARPAPIAKPQDSIVAAPLDLDNKAASAQREPTLNVAAAKERVQPEALIATEKSALVVSGPTVLPAETSAPSKPVAQMVDELVKVTRNQSTAVNGSVMAAYQAYTKGDDAEAERFYRSALQSEPRNIDALIGLAAVSLRQGNADQATASYLHVLELEPRNATAQAGLISLTSQADPLASESRLKTMLAQQPDAAFLHATLGNLYAEDGRWSLAQQSYFQAIRYDASSAEYAFNLAVSLDHMGKHKLAVEYYQRALELLPHQGVSSLDRAGIETRIAQIESAAE